MPETHTHSWFAWREAEHATGGRLLKLAVACLGRLCLRNATCTCTSHHPRPQRGPKDHQHSSVSRSNYATDKGCVSTKSRRRNEDHPFPCLFAARLWPWSSQFEDALELLVSWWRSVWFRAGEVWGSKSGFKRGFCGLQP